MNILSFWDAAKEPLNDSMISTLIITGVLCLFFIILYFAIRKVDPLKKTPKWLVPYLWMVDLMNNFVKTNIGIRWKSYAAWFLSLTIYIFFANISAVYFLENPTGYLIIPFALATCTFVIIQISSIRSNGLWGHLKSYADPIPLFIPMNIISDLSLPVSLSLRLFGNVTSGVIISILIKGVLGYFAIPFMPFINALFDIAFSIIQVAVFVILSIIFTSMKIKDEEKIYSN